MKAAARKFAPVAPFPRVRALVSLLEALDLEEGKVQRTGEPPGWTGPAAGPWTPVAVPEVGIPGGVAGSLLIVRGTGLGPRTSNAARSDTLDGESWVDRVWTDGQVPSWMPRLQMFPAGLLANAVGPLGADRYRGMVLEATACGVTSGGTVMVCLGGPTLGRQLAFRVVLGAAPVPGCQSNNQLGTSSDVAFTRIGTSRPMLLPVAGVQPSEDIFASPAQVNVLRPMSESRALTAAPGVRLEHRRAPYRRVRERTRVPTESRPILVSDCEPAASHVTLLRVAAASLAQGMSADQRTLLDAMSTQAATSPELHPDDQTVLSMGSITAMTSVFEPAAAVDARHAQLAASASIPHGGNGAGSPARRFPDVAWGTQGY